ncbi:EF-P beta-lysylation protein EpmB [Alteromonas sp. ASW11-36]|uniref:L-lysine 2,3-aminomutase n=1 Tax=Alteromonas arenosi TaxID=3055817 RepID=A0ABT7SZW0_9ALTE|nr:EF-P beta-lysylation protein EpmB [Alteromonas sp. ASW11-36]MDM7861706.1 EF-P beta-lysylation protein EpmB [Alteromonas sp. ASW11-36]
MAQIIPKKPVSVESNWQKELALSFTDPVKLLEYLQINPADYALDAQARRLFPMRVPRHFAQLMRVGDPRDPLLLQVMPNRAEFDSPTGYVTDPLEEQSTRQPGMLHKYKSRVLMIVRGGCAVNCRYCFRRHFPYADNSPNIQQLQNNLAAIAADTNINEVILSGGDPLMAKDSHLARLASDISAIPHIKRLRIHTRLPVVLPQRIDDSFVQWFSELKLQRVLVLHINHANEVSPQLAERLASLQRAGVMLLNQAVLLKGVNDSVEAQVALSEALFAAGIMPYYLHLLDKVQGAAHFDISDEKARELMHGMLTELPGFLVPKLVREEAGKTAKSPIDLHFN